jgi:hypothetical protein
MVKRSVLCVLVLASMLCVGALLHANSFVLAELSASDQKALQGGIVPTECLSDCTTCEDYRGCQNDTQCNHLQGVRVCTDDTTGERCYEVSWTLLMCVMDPAHTCNESFVCTRTCSTQAEECVILMYTQGTDCGGVWVTQCHF